MSGTSAPRPVPPAGRISGRRNRRHAGRRPLPLGSRGMELSTLRVSERTVLMRVAGEIDLLTAPYLQSQVSAQLGSPVSALVLDLRQVTFLGCSGLHALLSARQAAAESATSLRLLGGSRAVTRPLSLVGMADLLQPDPGEPPGPAPRRG